MKNLVYQSEGTIVVFRFAPPNLHNLPHVLWETSAGAEVAKPMAIPSIGGMAMALVSVFIIPPLPERLAQGTQIKEGIKEISQYLRNRYFCVNNTPIVANTIDKII